MASQPPSSENELPGNDPILTDAERAVLDTAAAEAAAAAGTSDQPASPAPPEAPADGSAAAASSEAGAPTADPEPPAVTHGAPAAETAPAPAAPSSSPIYTPTIQPGAARDFSAELSALKDQYKQGQLDDDTYEAQREKIIEDRAVHRAQGSIAEQLAEQGWAANVNAFLLMPENAALNRSPEMGDLWQAMMQRAVDTAAAAGQPLSDWQILAAGRDLLYQTLGLSTTPQPTAPAATPPPPPPPRAPDLTSVPPTLARAPAAAPTGAKTTAETLASSNDIQEIEAFMATQTEAQADELLRSLPGAFVDG